VETGRITKKHVNYWWMKHGLPYSMQQIEEQNRVSCSIYSLQENLCVSFDCLFLSSPELMKASEVVTSTRALRRAEMACEQRLLHEGPPQLRRLVMMQRLRQTYLQRL
jgi:hypothetical protein